MIILFEVIAQVAEEARPETPISLQLPVETSGIVNSNGNEISIDDPGWSEFYKFISKVKELYSRTLLSVNVKLFIVIFPDKLTIIRPVAIFSMM